MNISIIQSQNTRVANQQKQASGLQNGDVVHGKVVQQQDGSVCIATSDGQVLNAMLSDNVQLADGQAVSLMVNGRQDGKMVMQIVPEGGQANYVLESALGNMNIPVSETAVGLAASFVRQGVSISPELMQRANDIMAQLGVDAETAAFMAANGMDVTMENAQAVGDLASRQNGINAQLAQIEQILIDNGFTMPETESGQPAQPGQAVPEAGMAAQPQDGLASQTAQAAQAEQRPGQLQQVFMDNQPAGAAPQQALDVTATQTPLPADMQAAAQDGQPAQPNVMLKEDVQPAQPQAVADGPEGQAAQSDQPIRGNGAEQNVAQPAQQGEATAQGQAMQVQPGSEGGQGLAVFQPGEQTVKALTLLIGRDNLGAVRALGGDGVATAANVVATAAALPEEQAQAVIRTFIDQQAGRMEPADLQRLETQLTDAANLLRSSVQSPGRDGGMSKLMEQLQNIFAKLDGGDKNIQVKHASNRLAEKLEDMSETLAKATSAGAGHEAIAARVDRALGQSRAMEQINQFIYAQIPMEMNGQRNMAELYVFKRPGGAREIDIEDVTMMIALDTQNIGHIDSIIKVEMKNVFLRFKVELDSVGEALETNKQMFAEQLQEAGFHLADLRCELSEEDTNIINAATVAKSEFLDLHHNLDVKI